MSEILKEFLVKTLNITSDEAAELFDTENKFIEEKSRLLYDKDAERIARFKIERDNQFKRGAKLGKEELERAVKERFSVNSDKFGIELIEELIDGEKGKYAKTEVGHDFEKNPKYVELLSKFEKEKSDLAIQWQGKINEVQTGYQKKETLAKVSSFIDSEFERLNPILPEDAEKAKNVKRLFMREFDAGNYDITSDGQIIQLDNEGKPIQDKHGNLPKFPDVIKETASKYFDFMEGGQRSSPSGRTTSTGNQQQKKFANFREAQQFISDNKITDAKVIAETLSQVETV